MNKKIIITYGLSFIFCLFLAVAAVGSGCYFGFVSEDSLKIAFDESESFNEIREGILDGIDYSGVPYGFDRLTAENILTKDLVRGDLSSYINARYGGEEFELNDESFENNYYFGIGGIYAEKNLAISEEGEKQIDEYMPVFKEYYKCRIEGISLDGFTAIKENYGGLIKSVMLAGIIGAIICAIAILLVEKEKRNCVQAVGFGLIAGGIISMILPSYLLVTRGYVNLLIFQKFMYELTVTFIRNGLLNVNFFGGFFLMCGIICAAADILFMDKNTDN